MSSPRPLPEEEGISASPRPTKIPRLDRSLSPRHPIQDTRQPSPSYLMKGSDINCSVEPVSSPSPPVSDAKGTTAAGICSDGVDRESTPVQGQSALDLLEEEITCGMCAGIYIDPVVLNGCGHSFCGSCIQSWIKSMPPPTQAVYEGDSAAKPVSCPHCRHSPITEARPSRLAKAMVEILLKGRPEAGRSEREMQQARDIYIAAMGTLKFPVPPPHIRAREVEYWKPCRSCRPTAEDAWRCPVPIARPNVPEEAALCLRRDGLCPEGHRLCSGCDQLCPSEGPSSINCSLCGEGYCGDEQKHACSCVPLARAKPGPQWTPLYIAIEESASDLLSIAFRDNWVEMNHLASYLAALPPDQQITPDIILASLLSTIEAAGPSAKSGLDDLISSSRLPMSTRDSDDSATSETLMVCGSCADNLFCSALYEWWLKELEKPEVKEKLPKLVRERPNCKKGRDCAKQHRTDHVNRFNHVCNPAPDDDGEEQQDADAQGSSLSNSSSNGSEASNSPGRYVDVGVQAGETTRNDPANEVPKDYVATIDRPVIPDPGLPTNAPVDSSSAPGKNTTVPAEPRPDQHLVSAHDLDLPDPLTPLAVAI